MEKRDYSLFNTFEDDFDFTPSRNLSKEALLSKLFVQLMSTYIYIYISVRI